MTKIIVSAPKMEDISFYANNEFDILAVGIKGYSENFNNYVDINDLEEYISEVKKFNKEIYVFFNRLFYEDEIDGLKDIIKRLIKLNIENIGFTDYALLNILKELNYKGNIIWLSNHLGTNSNIINFLNTKNVKTVFLSTELTLDEILKIKENTNSKLIVKMYGHLLMATSSRKLLTNYFDYISKEKVKNKYVFKEKNNNNEYIIVENDNSTFFTKKVLNAIKYFKEIIDNDIDFIYLDDYMLEKKDFYNIIEAFSALRRAHDDIAFIKKLDEVVNVNTPCETFDGFFNKKTVFKVKDYE